MRIQTSLEFIALLAAVSSVALFAIGAYARTIMPQYKQISGSFSNVSSSTAPVYLPEKPGFTAQLPYSTELYKTSYVGAIFYNCSNGTANLSAYSSSLFFPVKKAELALKGLGTDSLPFVPTRTGNNSAELYYEIKCNGVGYSGAENLSTYTSAVSNSSEQSLYFAEIADRNERVNYSLGSESPIIYTTESTQCTKTDWNYNPLPIQYQCGTTSAWEYRTFSIYCYYNVGGTTTTTTCIYPHNTQYSTSSIGNATYSYSFLLKIRTPLGIAESNLSNAQQYSAIKLGNETIGSASVESVSYFGSGLSGGVLINGSVFSLANASAYAAYVQASDNLYSVLDYYNKTLDYSQQIYQAIYAYNVSSESLIGSRSQGSECLFNKGHMSCVPSQPFDYVIAAHINASGMGNETLQYAGSVINIISSG
ncbi:MAG: hypothetical protein QXT43_02695 [Candidatus Micrarchaeaceae archaeon]